MVVFLLFLQFSFRCSQRNAGFVENHFLTPLCILAYFFPKEKEKIRTFRTFRPAASDKALSPALQYAQGSQSAF